jgi:hypothetical protein
MAQRASLTVAEKQLILDLKAAGLSLRAIGVELNCSWQTVRKWWRWGRQGRSSPPRGRPKRGALSTFSSELRQQAVALKQVHPHWGPKQIRLELQPEVALRERGLPSPARLSALFKERCPEAVQPRQPRLLPPADPQVRTVHQRWQMDAKEGLPLGSAWVNVQEIRDVYSGLMIASQAFEAPRVKQGWQHLHREAHQAVLRQAFCDWGMPLEVQTDNDQEFASITDPSFPTLLSLWLIGLGVSHIHSRPHRPTDQPQIERNHRTQGDFVWKDQAFEQLALLQAALDEDRRRYNETYPSQAAHCHGAPPLTVFPTAQTTGRPYHPDLEWDLFDLARVDAFLGKQVWTRKVASNGVVHVGGQYYILGRAWKGQVVSIRFLPQTRSFRFQTKSGTLIMDLLALGLEKEQIMGLIPAHLPLPSGFQFALPWAGV